MPELPDVLLYLHCLEPRVVGRVIERVTVISPFVLRTFEPPIDAIEGLSVRGLRRLGKRIVFAFDGDLFLVVHPMIAGRFRWQDGEPSAKKHSKIVLATLRFPNGTLLLTEAGTKKRASMHVVRGEAGLDPHRRSGIDVLVVDREAFAARLRSVNHTLKRALTDPRLFDGIGNAYSDEILHRAGLSPIMWTSRLDDDAVATLYDAARVTLREWIDRLREQTGDGFPGPGAVTAFRPEMAVHGKFGVPCPVCGTIVQRIVYAQNETNYCPRCQTGGRLLADRSLSRLLKDDWPRTVEELEEIDDV